jgi:hypothetical protein
VTSLLLIISHISLSSLCTRRTAPGINKTPHTHDEQEPPPPPLFCFLPPLPWWLTAAGCQRHDALHSTLQALNLIRYYEGQHIIDISNLPERLRVSRSSTPPSPPPARTQRHAPFKRERGRTNGTLLPSAPALIRSDTLHSVLDSLSQGASERCGLTGWLAGWLGWAGRARRISR